MVEGWGIIGVGFFMGAGHEALMMRGGVLLGGGIDYHRRGSIRNIFINS